MNKQDVVIVEAKRTATGKFFGGLKDKNSVALATELVKKSLADLDLDKNQIDQVIMGSVLQTGIKQNLARQVQLGAGLPDSGTAMTINQVCGSSLKAIRLAQSAILMGDADVVIAGGSESMSNAPFFARRSDKMDFDHDNIADTLFYDGLNDPFHDYPMGVTAENLNDKFGVTREQLDEFAVKSQHKAAQATANGNFDQEIIPINGVKQDELIRPNTNMDVLSQLKAVYKDNGSVTAGNTSPLSDGASMAVLMTAAKAHELVLKPLVKITGYQEVGYHPELMGYTPTIAIQKLLAKKQQTVQDIDLFEVNEAFATQAVILQDKLNIPDDKFNISGGALALGHALGSSGTRIVTTLINNLRRTNSKTGIAALCIGGGQGIALEIETLS